MNKNSKGKKQRETHREYGRFAHTWGVVPELGPGYEICDICQVVRRNSDSKLMSYADARKEAVASGENEA